MISNVRLNNRLNGWNPIMIPHHPGHIVIELDQWRSLLQQSVCVRVHNAIDHSISILIIIIDNIDLHTLNKDISNNPTTIKWFFNWQWSLWSSIMNKPLQQMVEETGQFKIFSLVVIGKNRHYTSAKWCLSSVDPCVQIAMICPNIILIFIK